MAVKVKVLSTTDPNGATVSHDEANRIEVHGDHLFVKNGSSTVAIYAPGRWFSVAKDSADQ